MTDFRVLARYEGLPPQQHENALRHYRDQDHPARLAPLDVGFLVPEPPTS